MSMASAEASGEVKASKEINKTAGFSIENVPDTIDQNFDALNKWLGSEPKATQQDFCLGFRLLGNLLFGNSHYFSPLEIRNKPSLIKPTILVFQSFIEDGNYTFKYIKRQSTGWHVKDTGRKKTTQNLFADFPEYFDSTRFQFEEGIKQNNVTVLEYEQLVNSGLIYINTKRHELSDAERILEYYVYDQINIPLKQMDEALKLLKSCSPYKHREYDEERNKTNNENKQKAFDVLMNMAAVLFPTAKAKDAAGDTKTKTEAGALASSGKPIVPGLNLAQSGDGQSSASVSPLSRRADPRSQGRRRFK